MEQYKKVITAICIIQMMVAVITVSTPSKNISFTLGQNLILNSNFTVPILTNYVQGFSKYKAGWSTKQKDVQFYKPVNALGHVSKICPAYVGVNLGETFLDTDSFFCNQYYYQNISLNGIAQFYISLDHISEIPNNLTSTGLTVLWNGEVLATFFEDDCILKSSGFYVFSKIGINELAFRGQGSADCYGIVIRNIQLRQIIYGNQTQLLRLQSANSIEMLLNSSDVHMLQRVNQIFTSILFSLNQNTAKIFLGYFMEFNHLILFNYYQGNFTFSFAVIVNIVQALENQKGAFIDSYIYSRLNASSMHIFDLFASNNNITTPSVVYFAVNTYLPNRNSSFLLSLTDFLFWEMPLAISTLILGLILFKMFFKYRISLLFRSYSFIGYIFIIFFEGKMEILTFDFFSEFLMPFSSDYTNKLTIAAMLLFYFVIFFFSIGGMILFYAFYKKKAKYLYENAKVSGLSIAFMLYTAGIFNLSLGAAHRLLLYSPDIQVKVIVGLEASYILYYVSHIVLKKCQTVCLSFIIIGMSFCRILLYFFLLLNFDFTSIYANLIDSATLTIFVVSLGLMSISICIFFLHKICLIIKIIQIPKCFTSTNGQKSQEQQNKLQFPRNTHPKIILICKNRLKEISKKQQTKVRRFLVKIKLFKSH